MAWGDNLVEYWPNDEASGDAVGVHAGLVLTDNGSVGSSTGRTYGTARTFVLGSGQSLVIADRAEVSFGDEPWTIGFEVYFESTLGFDYQLLGKGSDAEYKIQKNSGNHLEQYVWAGPGNLNNNDSPNTVIATTWISVLMWHDPINNLIGITEDGSDFSQPWSNGTLDSTGSFYVGHNAFDGRIGPVAIWRRLLDAGEKASWPLSYAGMGLGGGGGGAQPVRARHHTNLMLGSL